MRSPPTLAGTLALSLVACLLLPACKSHASASTESAPPPPGAPSTSSSAAPSSAPPEEPPPPGSIVVRDAAEYAVTLPADTGPCIQFPASLYDPASCPPEAHPAANVPTQEKVRLLAIGFLRLEDQGAERRAQITVSLNKMAHSYAPDMESASALAAGMADEIPKRVAGATIRDGRPTVRLTRINGLTAARIEYDVDGATGLDARLQHSVSYTVWSPEGAYIMAITGPSDSGPAFDLAADRIAQSLRLAHPAPRRPR